MKIAGLIPNAPFRLIAERKRARRLVYVFVMDCSGCVAAGATKDTAAYERLTRRALRWTRDTRRAYGYTRRGAFLTLWACAKRQYNSVSCSKARRDLDEATKSKRI